MNARVNTYRFWGAVAAAARLQSVQTDRGDTLPRVRLRPVGKAMERQIGRDFGDQLTDLYDPDAIAKSFYHPSHEFAQNYFVPVRSGGEWLDPVGHHRLQVVERYREGGRWKTRLIEHKVRSAKALRDLTETQEYKRSRFLETTGDWLSRISQHDYARLVERDRVLAAADVQRRFLEAQRQQESTVDPFTQGNYPDFVGSGTSVTRGMDQEYVPIMGGPYHRQLYLYAHWEQTAKAFEMRHHSELAKTALMITTDFTLGRGVAWKIKNQAVSDVWQEFWDRNNMDERLRRLADDLTWQGELLIRKYEILAGFVAIRSLDPGAIYEIVTDPLDIETVFFYHASYPTQYQQPYTSFHGQQLNIPLMKYVITQYPATEVFHIKNNVSSSEKWGRSDFYNSLSTLKRHRDWTNAATLKDLLQSNLVWTITLQGDEGDVQAFLSDPNNAQLPAFGGVWVQNSALKLDVMHQDVSATTSRGSGNTGAFLTALFAAAQQMPLTYFNDQSRGMARATALSQGEPFAKKILSRQQQLARLLDHLYTEVMQRAVAAGRLSLDAIRGDDADPDWIFPTIYEEDRGAKLSDLYSAKGMAVISQRTMAEQVAAEFAITDYDYDDEQAEIAIERSDPLLQYWPPAAGGPQAVKPPPMPNQPVPALPSAAGSVPPPTPGTTGAAPAGRGPALAGRDARAQFKRQQRERPSAEARAPLQEGAKPLTALDQRVLEGAIRRGVAGTVHLPSGRRVTIAAQPTREQAP